MPYNKIYLIKNHYSVPPPFLREGSGEFIIVLKQTKNVYFMIDKVNLYDFCNWLVMIKIKI
jgi:hypothetical protein